MQHFRKVPSLRSLCCMAVQVFKLDKEVLPQEIKETIKEIKSARKPQLAKYLVLRNGHHRVYTEFLDGVKNILVMMAERDGDFGTLHSLLRKECSVFKSLVKFVPTEQERELIAKARETFAYALIGQYSVAKRIFLMEMVFWTGPERVGVFWC
ncbi:hypothetical protein C8_463 [Cannes 8 virus]|nr:hypothetical protein MEL_389 [Melbournevirus]AGV01812.1 hypothetical protein C8_463 [Cannes 8 virus]AIT55002.1 hypothetical protein MEL_389 [Melbournevirus]